MGWPRPEGPCFQRSPDEHKFFSAAAERFALRVLQGPPMRPLGLAADAPPIPAVADADGAEGAAAHDPATVRILEFEWLGRGG